MFVLKMSNKSAWVASKSVFVKSPDKAKKFSSRKEAENFKPELVIFGCASVPLDIQEFHG